MADEETERIKALHSYRILDSDPERGFDDLTHLASFICETPIALITLIDTDRQWFKSRVGLAATQTSRDVSFCTFAIREPDLFIVPDATSDARFRDNPFVVSDPQIRFYAGVPLVTRDGHALGTLCVIDREPRQLRDEQEQALRALARQALAQLEWRKDLLELQAALELRDRAEEQREALIGELRLQLSQVKKLSGLIPHCSSCQLDMTIPADPSKINTITDGVMRILEEKGWAQGAELQIETALREALANAIVHGCKNDPAKKVQCCVALDDSGEVMIIVRDPGAGFDTAALPDPIRTGNLLNTSGRGIFLINQLMDEVSFKDGGREVWMHKRGRED